MFLRQAHEAHNLLQSDQFEYLLSEKQLAFWQWVKTQKEFSRKSAIDALQYPSRTVEGIVKKFLGMKKIERLGRGSKIQDDRIKLLRLKGTSIILASFEVNQ